MFPTLFIFLYLYTSGVDAIGHLYMVPLPLFLQFCVMKGFPLPGQLSVFELLVEVTTSYINR